MAHAYHASAKLMASARATTLLDRIEGPRGCLFTFHRVAPAEEWDRHPNRGFFIKTEFLQGLFQHLRRDGWEFVSTDEVISLLRGGSHRRRFVNFSIDDCYRDTYEHLAPVFVANNVPVTLYVTTGIPDNSLVLWASGIETIIARQDRVLVETDGTVTEACVAAPAAKRALYAELTQAWEADDAIARYHRFCRLNGYDAERLHEDHAITWDMLTDLRSKPLVTIGAHTVSHPRMSELSEDAARDEMARSRTRLRERLGCDVRHLAFPYGRRKDCGPRDFALARSLGFASAATTQKALLFPNSSHDPYALPRVTINGNDQSTSLIDAHLIGLSSLASALARVR